jgi:hypothetical protein
VLVDNLEIFRKNGFDFDIDESAQHTKRVRMTKIPISKVRPAPHVWGLRWGVVC